MSEKSLHPPPSPAMLPDHLKCNILKAQMEAAFRVSARVSFSSLARIPCIEVHTFILFKGSSDNAESEALKRDSP